MVSYELPAEHEGVVVRHDPAELRKTFLQLPHPVSDARSALGNDIAAGSARAIPQARDVAA